VRQELQEFRSSGGKTMRRLSIDLGLTLRANGEELSEGNPRTHSVTPELLQLLNSFFHVRV
jgi:hypothetical protein